MNLTVCLPLAWLGQLDIFFKEITVLLWILLLRPQIGAIVPTIVSVFPLLFIPFHLSLKFPNLLLPVYFKFPLKIDVTYKLYLPPSTRPSTPNPAALVTTNFLFVTMKEVSGQLLLLDFGSQPFLPLQGLSLSLSPFLPWCQFLSWMNRSHEPVKQAPVFLTKPSLRHIFPSISHFSALLHDQTS